MRLLIRAGTFALQLAVFFVLLAVLSLATTYFTAERYVEGVTPSRLFPLVGVRSPPSAAPDYELLRWHQLTRKDPPPLTANLRLPAAQGAFAASAATGGGHAPWVRFSSSAATGERQRVEVKVTEDDYVLYAAYDTDGVTARPEYLRVWGPSSALLAVFPAFVLTLVLSRLAGRGLQRAKAVAHK